MALSESLLRSPVAVFRVLTILHHHSLFTLALVSGVLVASGKTHPGWDQTDRAETNTPKKPLTKGISWDRGYDESA